MTLTWFKKENVIVETPTIQEGKVITAKDIQEDLHKSFEDIIKEFGLKGSKETEIEKLNEKLYNFKQENVEAYNKIETLQNLGLTSTPSIKKSLEALKGKEKKINEQVAEIQQNIKDSETIQNFISQYAIQYPCYKFIDKKTMFKIMEKYDLVLGDAFLYGREIPNENLEIINYFTSEIKESEEIMQLMSNSYDGRFKTYKFKKKEKVLEEKNTSDSHYKYAMMMGHSVTEYVEKEFKISRFKMIAPENHFVIPAHNTANYRSEIVETPLLTLGKDRKYIFTVDKLNEIEAKKREVLDPIACLEVLGGYIIMTAWDKEAEIVEIKNNMLN